MCFEEDFSGIRGGAAETVVDRFPVWGVGGEIDGDPIVVACISLVQLVIENRCVISSGMRHLADRNIRAVGGMQVLQVDSVALFGQPSCGHQQ